MNIITVGDRPFFDRIEFFDLVSLQLAQLSRVFDWLLASSVFWQLWDCTWQCAIDCWFWFYT